jgi:hypothetical protein
LIAAEHITDIGCFNSNGILSGSASRLFTFD